MARLLHSNRFSFNKFEVPDIFRYDWLWPLIILIFLSTGLSAQEYTVDNYTGTWSNNSSWVDGTNPGTTGINSDVHIYGNISSWNNLDFNQGDLFIYDTLVIYGNLTLGNNSNLTLYPGAILIVRGDYTSGNNVNVSSGGVMIVTGEFTMTGSDGSGSFDNDGELYIFDPDPDIKGGDGYGDVDCSAQPDSCDNYGGEDDLGDTDLGDFFFSGSFSIEASGSTTFCPGGSVTLSTMDSATSYQWFLDGISIAGATTFSYTATVAGAFHVDLVYSGEYFSLSAVDVYGDTVSPVITVCAADQNIGADINCEGTVPDLTGGVSVSDNCGTIASVTQSPLAGTVIGTGITTVTITATDDSGNSSSCTADLTVTDLTAPTITAPSDVAV
ncbi:MAG: HYR domain-containing protein, partial [Bacteroidales bacterium]